MRLLRHSPRPSSAAGAALLAIGFLLAAAVLAQQPSAPGTALAAASASSEAEPQRIDLPTVLRLAGLNDLDLALVREAEKQARAANEAMTLQFFPWLTAGGSYDKHGGAETELGRLFPNVQSELYTAGVSAHEQVELGDAIFQKLAARQTQRAAGFDVEASQNDTALAAAGAYFDLVNAIAATDIAREAVRISEDYEEQLSRAYQAGLTNRSELLRVGVQTQNERVLLRQVEAAVPSSSAVLATLLRLDPAVALEPVERLVQPATLVAVDTPVQALVKEALSFRPELKASDARIIAADKQRIAAKYGALIPSVTAQGDLNQLRGGVNNELSGYLSSHDAMIALNWRLGPGGLLDFSRTDAANSALRSEQLHAERLHDDIEQQVVLAYQAARAGLDQMGLARRAVELAQQSLALSTQRKEFGVYAVLEVVQAQQDLTRARANYAQALAQYAKSQYALARATARIGK